MKKAIDIARPVILWLTAVICFVVVVTACANWKNTARSVNDVAGMICEMTAEKYTSQSLDGLTPRQWCDIKEHLDPFINHVLSVPRPDGVEVGQ